MKSNIKDHLLEIQASMLESKCVKSCFDEPQQDHLRALIRLTVEFYDYLQNSNSELRNIVEGFKHRLGSDIKMPPKELELNELKYRCGSIFSGIDSFCSVNAVYRVLAGATSSSVEWGNVSILSIKDQFVSAFHEFTKETDFEKKCRFLLDLFKMQIVFAGMFYD
jgi:hypothetical protein